jgi:hypothetical protein
MTISRYTEEYEAPQYLAWRKQNPEGFVLNINTWNPKDTNTQNIIHRAKSCSSLDAPPQINRDRPVTPQHPKLCSTDIHELECEMEAKGLPHKHCGLCMKTSPRR